MASSSSLSFPLHPLRYTPSSSSSTRLGPGTAYRPSPSARLQIMQPIKGRLKSVTVTAASYEDEATAVGHHGDSGIAATTSLLHRDVADEVAPPELRVGGGALCSSPKGRPAGSPREDGGGGGGGKIHHAAAPTTFVKRVRGPTPPGLPAEGSGGNGGSKH